MNKVILVGLMGGIPELRQTQGGLAVARMSVATHEVRKDRDTAEHLTISDWHRVVAFGVRAENAHKYLAAGDEVAIEGRLKTRKWIGNDQQVHFSTEVVADRVEYLRRKAISKPPEPDESPIPDDTAAAPDYGAPEEDTPF